MNFFDTIRGHRFTEIVMKELPALTKELKRANDLKEQELKLKEGEKKDGSM